AYSGRKVADCHPVLMFRLTTARSPPPRLVVTKITPLAARDPYSEADEASFSTDMLAISLAFSEANSWLEAGIPSITNKGPGDPRLDRPRMEMVPVPLEVPSELRPTSPGRCRTVSPGDNPCRAFCTEVTGRSTNSCALMVATEPVKVVFFCVPNATTTTSSRSVDDGFKRTVIGL